MYASSPATPGAQRHRSLLAWKESSAHAGMERETWEQRKRLLKELEIFGWLRFHETLRGALSPDRHPDEFEIHYLKRGHLNWWVEGAGYEFRPGCVFIVKPGQLHGGDEESLQPCEHLWMRFRADRRLPGLDVVHADALRKGLKEIRLTTFPVSTTVGDHLDKILAEHRAMGPQSPLIARGLLHAVLATIIRDYQAHTSQPRSEPLVTWRIRRTLEILAKSGGRLAEDDGRQYPTIAQLAEKVGLSESGFRERFKAEIGFPPHEYILNQRIAEARRQLTETSHDITRIALDLGFSSSQYFATVFRRRVGMSPGAYRKRHKGNLPQPS